MNTLRESASTRHRGSWRAIPDQRQRTAEHKENTLRLSERVALMCGHPHPPLRPGPVSPRQRASILQTRRRVAQALAIELEWRRLRLKPPLHDIF
mmetsp:Transcript_81253/g.243577  ORF Transcript_81253/g.243577 Transcript_81253/m.243577 type:complete len:95 (+) Transcript_81253:106-390(+)|eukprot:6649196-Prymnesium_polylepis.1